MPRSTHPVIYVTNDKLKSAGINLDNFPSAGPNPNITGMKNKFWGKDAFCIKNGTCVYKVPSHIYFTLGGSAHE